MCKYVCTLFFCSCGVLVLRPCVRFLLNPRRGRENPPDCPRYAEVGDFIPYFCAKCTARMFSEIKWNEPGKRKVDPVLSPFENL